jgi:hypothetical protein
VVKSGWFQPYPATAVAGIANLEEQDPGLIESCLDSRQLRSSRIQRSTFDIANLPQRHICVPGKVLLCPTD